MATYTPSRIGSPGVGLSTPSHNPTNTSANTTLFRRLVWEGTVPLEIRIDGKELPADADRGLDSYYLQVPRIAYLPFIIPELRTHIAELVLNERDVGNIKEENWWFEDEHGSVVKWTWPIGLLYDIYVSSKTVSLAASFGQAQSSYPSSVHPQPTNPLRLTLHLTNPSQQDKVSSLALAPTQEACKQAFMAQLKEADFLRWGSTKRVTGLRKAEQDGIWEALKEHNFEEFWRVNAKITPTPSPVPLSNAPSSFNPNSSQSRPPSTEPGAERDKDAANAVRSVPIRIYLPDLAQSNHANSPAMTGLSAMSPSHPHLATVASTLPGTATTGTILQPLVPPFIDTSTPSSPSPGQPTLISGPGSGQPATLRSILESHLPLLFPPKPVDRYGFGAQLTGGVEKATLAHAIVHGVVIPDDAELGWLGACMAGADGWLCVVVGLGKGA